MSTKISGSSGPDDERKYPQSEEKAGVEASILDGVEIDDEVIERDDLNNKEARKLAKKNAKKHMTPEELKKIRHKKILITAGAAAMTLLCLFLIPVIRFSVLNFVGLRNDVIISVQDGSKKPVHAAQVAVDGLSPGTTDVYGRATIKGVKFGDIPIRITKPGYAKIESKFRSDIRTGRIDSYSMKIIGIKIDISVKDWLSGAAIKGASAKSGEASAVTDDSGVLSLVVMPQDGDELTVEVQSKGYISKKLIFDSSVRAKETLLVSSAKNYFISTRDGKYNIYSSNLDGSKETKIIEATGKERKEFLGFVISPDNQYAVLVANREGRIVNGVVVAGVYRIDLAKAQIDKIDEGTNVTLHGWAGKSAVYSKSSPTLRFDDAKASELVAYDLSTRLKRSISTSNSFYDVLTLESSVVYMSTNPYEPEHKDSIVKYNIDTGNRLEYAKGKKINYLTRPKYQIVDMMTEQGEVLSLNLFDGSLGRLEGSPRQTKYFQLIGDDIFWIERRDGKGVLIRSNQYEAEEKIITRIAGATEPVRIVNNKYAVVRVSTNSETADYVVDLMHAKSSKINDVFDVWQGAREWR